MRALLRLVVFNLEMGNQHKVEYNVDFPRAEVLLNKYREAKGGKNF